MERAVQSAGLDVDLAAAEPLRLLHDAVAVAVLLREREEHLKFHRAQRHQCVETIYAAHTCQGSTIRAYDRET